MLIYEIVIYFGEDPDNTTIFIHCIYIFIIIFHCKVIATVK